MSFIPAAARVFLGTRTERAGPAAGRSVDLAEASLTGLPRDQPDAKWFVQGPWLDVPEKEPFLKLSTPFPHVQVGKDTQLAP